MKCNLREIVFGSILASKPIPNHLQRFLRVEVRMRVAGSMRDRLSTA